VYYQLRGQLIELNPTAAVLDVAGVGYDLRIPLSTYERLKGKKDVCLFTHLHVREDELRLFGFFTTGERDLFRLLLSVTGVGPSTALASLCALTPEDVARAISAGDHKTLQKIKGVGRKLAERLVVELRDRVGALLVLLGVDESRLPAGAQRPPQAGPGKTERPKVALDAVGALVALGFDRKSAEERVDTVYRQLAGPQTAGPTPAVDLEQLIKASLRSS